MPHLTPAADLAVFLVSLGAGLIGALGGVGGGLIIVPALIILFGVDVQVAAGASIVAVIATSSGAAAAYVRDGLANMRIGMFLELATAYAGQLYGIDAFNQPGVELGKQFAYALLGRPGAGAAKKEWDSLPKSDQRWSV